MKALMLTFGSFMLTAGVVMNAYYQKKQFYPSVVYITKSNPSMAVLYLQAFVFVILMGKLCRKIFFGQLRPAEVEHLIERSWYAVTETCLAFTVFRDDFSSRFVALFTMLLFLKCFHWLGEDRIDYMERSPVITWSFHLRVLGLILGLAGLDLFFVHHAYYSTLIKGASVQLVFGFEYAILLTIVVTMFVKYVLHTIDLQNENPWENKAVYLLYSELFLGFIRVMLYFVFLAIMIKVHTFPLFAIRPMYLTMRAFKKALNDVIMSRRAIRNMNTLYPDATPEELASGDNVCIICREEMVNNCKKLPCSHIFHTSCMRSWFQRQQTCPTCRMDVLRPSPRPAQTQPAQQPAQPAPEQQQPQPGMPGWFPMWMPPAQQQQQQQQQPQQQQAQGPAGSAESTATSSTTTTTPPSASPGPSSPFSPGVPPFMMPPMMMPMPFYTPMPMPSTDLTNLSDEEVRAMEGYERKNVEARIQVLRNIQTLLDGAVAQMHQYSTVFNNYGDNSFSQQQGSAFTFPSPPQQSGGPAANTTTTTTSTVGSAPISSTLPPSSESSTQAASKPPVTTVNGSGDADAGELEGAVGYSSPPEENISSWHDDRFEDSDSEEVREIRRRRLERFSSLNNERTQENENHERKLKDNLELD